MPSAIERRNGNYRGHGGECGELFLLIDWIGAVLAFLLERGEQLELTLLVALQRFLYRQVMYSVVVRSIIAALHGD